VTLLKQKYPELHIEGENFNPSGYNMFIAKGLVIIFQILYYFLYIIYPSILIYNNLQ